MVVTIVADVLGEENNGTTIAAMNLYRALIKQGHEVRIVCDDKCRKGQKGFYVVPHIWLGFIVRWLLKKNHVTLAFPKKKIIKQALHGADIVHLMTPFALCRKSACLAKKMHIPITAGFHCQAENLTSHIAMMNCHKVNSIVYRNYYRGMYKKCNAIHYPTSFIRNVFEAEVKKETPGYVISNGVNKLYCKKDVIRKGALADKFNILFIGRIAKEKSHYLLIKAVALSKYKDNIQLVFAGKGPRENEVKKLWEKEGIHTPIMNFYSREELVDVINSCDLYVHPAEIEIEAISCLEAITCGLVPVISNSPRSATNAFAMSDKNLFQYDDPQNLADKIDYWIEHPEEKAECSKSYLGYTKQFNQDECMNKMINMLQETIENYEN